MRVVRTAGVALWLLAAAVRGDVRGCVCDAARPETMAQRQCSLCREAESHPAEPAFFVIHDASPNKPNRWLALPRFHGSNPQDLDQMTPAQRMAYWSMAIAKGQELWGDRWGLAINSIERRTQCHMHIHVGQLRDGVEDDNFVVVDGPANIPLPAAADGMWVHPAGGKLHVHRGNDTPELLLVR